MGDSNIETMKLVWEMTETEEELLKLYGLINDFHATVKLINEIYLIGNNDWEHKAYTMAKLAERMCNKMPIRKYLEKND